MITLESQRYSRPHRCENRCVTVTDDIAATSAFDALQIPLPEEELQERFEALQRKLVAQWELIEGFTTSRTGSSSCRR